MKKTLIAMAAVAVAGVASAQVTLSGSMGFGFSDTSAGARTGGMTDGNVTFSASEDLGGGMSVSGSFTMDGQGSQGNPSMDGQSLALNMGSAGSLTMGEVNANADKLGVASLSYSTNDVFGGNTAGYSYAQYTLPTMVEGLTANLRWTGAGGTVETADAKPQYRFNYKFGDASVDFNTKGSSAGTASEVLVAYTIQGITLKAFADTARPTTSATKRSEYSISAPLGAMTVSASNATKGALKGTEVNATYSLSKRTAVSVNFGSFTGGTSTSANRVKLVHSF